MLVMRSRFARLVLPLLLIAFLLAVIWVASAVGAFVWLVYGPGAG